MVSFRDDEYVGRGFIDIEAEDQTDRGLRSINRNLERELTRAGKRAGDRLVEAFDRAADEAGDDLLDQMQKDLRQLERDIEASMRRSGRSIDEELSEAGRAASQRLVERMTQAGDEAGDGLLREMQDDIALLSHELDELASDRAMTLEADLDDGLAKWQLRWLTRPRFIPVFPVLMARAFRRDLNKLLKGISGFDLVTQWKDAILNLLSTLPQTVVRLGLLSAAFAAVLNPILTMIGALGPLARSLWSIWPLILTGPAILGAMGAQVGLLIAAFGNLGDTTNRQAVIFRNTAKSFTDDLEDIRNVIQTGFFAEVTGPFREVAQSLLPQIRIGMEQLAPVMGSSIGAMLEGINESLGEGGLEDFFRNVTSMVREAEPGMRGFAFAFSEILRKGSEILPDFGRWVSEVGTAFAEWAVNADIEQMIRDAATQFGFLMDVVRETGGIIAGIWRAMDTGGSVGLQTLAEDLERIHELVDSEAFQTAVGSIFQGAADGLAEFNKHLPSIGDSLEVIAPLIGDILREMGGAAGVALAGILEAIASPVAQNGLEAALKGISQMMREIDWAALGPIIGSLGEAVGELAPHVSDLINAMLPHIPGIIDAIGELIPLLGPLIKLFDSLLELIDPLAKSFENGIPVIGSMLEEFVDFIDPAIDATTDFLDKYVELAEAMEEGGGLFGDPADATEEEVERIRIALDEFLSIFGTSLDELTLGKQRLGELLTAFAAEVQKFFEPLVLFFQNIQKEIDTRVLGVQNAIMTFLLWLETTFTPVLESIKIAWDTFWYTIEQIIAGAILVIQALINGDFSGAMKVMEDVWNNIRNAWATAWTQIESNMRTFFANLVSIFTGGGNQLKSGANDTKIGVQNPFRDMMRNIIVTVQKGIAEVVNWFTGLHKRITGALSGAKSWLVQTGRDLIQGMINGARELVGTLVATITGAANQSVYGAKKVLKERSPSRVFYEIGANTMRGMMLGIKALQGDLAKTMIKAMPIPATPVPALASAGFGVQSINSLQGVGRLSTADRPTVSSPAVPTGQGRSGTYVENLVLEQRETVAEDMAEVVFQLRAFEHGAHDDGEGML